MRVQKYKRGQIWWADLGDEFNGHIQAKIRPVVIISNDKGNYFSTLCTVIPCTSSDKKDIPTHVHCIFNGTKNVMLTEQIVTINKDQFKGYIGTLDDELATKVDEAICESLGLESYVAGAGWNNMLEECKYTAPIEFTAAEKDIIQQDIEATVELANTIFEPPISLPEDENVEVTIKARGRKPQYTLEDKIRFINDYENHDADYMLKKYDILNKKALTDKVYRFRKEIKENS